MLRHTAFGNDKKCVWSNRTDYSSSSTLHIDALNIFAMSFECAPNFDHECEASLCDSHALEWHRRLRDIGLCTRLRMICRCMRCTVVLTLLFPRNLVVVLPLVGLRGVRLRVRRLVVLLLLNLLALKLFTCVTIVWNTVGCRCRDRCVVWLIR